MNKLSIGPGLRLPLDAATETFGIVGVKGSGKTTTARVLVEELTAAGQQAVVIDPLGVWWGVRAAADGKRPGLPFTILGGDHGDLPITADSGEVVADLAVDEPVPLVVDLSLLRKGEQRRLMTAFLERIYHRNRGVLHLVIDEADLYGPQRPMKGDERLLGAMEDLVRRGRARGLGVSLITQRPAVLHKDLLSQVGCLVAHRLVGPQDRAAIDAWVQAHGTREQRDELMASIASLPTGTAWFWSPAWLDLFARVAVRAPQTFDSSATPKAGARTAEPAAFASVDLDALRERLAAVVQRAEQTDPKALRRRVVELERELSRQQPMVETRVERVEVPVLDVARLERLQTALRPIAAAASEISSAMTSVMAEIDQARDQTPAPAVMTNGHSPRPRPPSTPRPATPAPVGEGDVQLKAGARRLLATLARSHPLRVTKAQLGTLAGFKITGGTFQTYFGTLRRAGLIDLDGDGLIYATDAGLAEAGVGGGVGEPITTEEVLERWRAALKKGAREMLDLLVAAYPNSIGRDELADRLGMTASGGTFQTYLGTLRRNGLAEVDGGEVRASASLFLAPA